MKGKTDEAVNIDLNGKMLKFTTVYPELFSGYLLLIPTKMKSIYTIILFLISSITSNILGQNYRQVEGTRFMVNLPNDFKFDKNISGFVSESDSSVIIINEITNPYSYEELLNKRILNAHKMGIDTSNFKKSTFNGYKSLEYKIFDSVLGYSSFNISFGSDDFFVDISIEGSKDRIEELKPIILNGKYNENLNIDYDNILGFTISYEGSKHKIFKKDANTINTSEVDSFGNTISYLNVTKMPKDMFSNFSDEKSIDLMYQYYFPDRQYKSTNEKIVDKAKFIWKEYSINKESINEYNVIGLIRRENFDLLIVGGAINEEKIDLLLGLIESIKFKNGR